MSKLLSMGEVLIDFIPLQKGLPLKDVATFERTAGGAPANVAATVAKLGSEAEMIGKVGKDAFGDFLLAELDSLGITIEKLFQTEEANTALAFVSLSSSGERDFSFYRNPSADLLLTEHEIDPAWFESGNILHFCSVGLVESPLKYAHKKAIKLAQAKNCLISFDPNVRLPLWENPKICRDTILEFIPEVNIIKISDEELSFITQIDNEQEAISALFKGRVQLVLLTKGANGSAIYTRDFHHYTEGYSVDVRDTTGAGDAFIGACLHLFLKNHVTRTTLEDYCKLHGLDMLHFANACGALTTTKKGAISAIPTKAEVIELVKQ